MWAKASCLAVITAVVGSVLGASHAAAQSAAGPRVDVLSSQPSMVTGGDALIKVAGANRPTVIVDGTDVSGGFTSDHRDSWIGLVTGLKDGDNTLAVSSGGGAPSTVITLTNHALNCTLFGGPQQQPFLCEDESFNLGAAKDANCSADVAVRYIYLGKSDNKWKDFDPQAARPTDIADTQVGAARVPLIVRIESGVINRAGYVISMLYDPAAGPLPNPEDQAVDQGWNGKLIYAFGGGMQPAFHMGRATGLSATDTGASIMGDNLIKLGYALASASLDRAGGNNNDVTAAETMAKVKEHFIEEFGPPMFTIGYGPSGGATMQNLVANNYPGLLDGIIPERLFSDTMTFLEPLYDCELLTNYFDHTDRVWTDAQKTAVAGTSTFGFCTSNGTRYPNARPDDCDAAVKAAISANNAFRANPPRCTYQDNLVNIFGQDPNTGFARNPFDNVGVQYGLAAFNRGVISFDDFVDLNRKIGGLDGDGKIVFGRQAGDPVALTAAYETGRVNEGGAGLSDIPILDIRTWHELASAPDGNVANVDVHNAVQSKIFRDRLVRSNGDADNVVSVTVVEVANKGEGSAIQLVELKYLTYLDQWLTAIQRDTRPMTQAQKVRADRPVEMADACFPTEWLRITDMSQCSSTFPIAGVPRTAAGGPNTADIFKCQLKPATSLDYGASVSSAQMVILNDVFPDGVCDYSRPGVGQVPLAGTWLTYPHVPGQAPVVATTATAALPVDPAARITEVQQRLVASGYDPGSADGILGPRTRAAVIQFEKAKGLAPSPQITDDLLNALRAAK
jgi:Tannase-like family of unknown function (DUF6351)/Putative peptidoglycan binding domain